MKNNSIFFKILTLYLLLFASANSFVYAKDVTLKASEVLAYEEGNIIIGKDNAEAKIDNEIEIYGDKITYNKKKQTILAEGNVIVVDIINQIEIKSNKIDYSEINNQVISVGKTFFVIKNKYKIDSSDVYFNISDDTIFSDKETYLIDDINNKITLSSFKYFNQTQQINGSKIEIEDNEKNKYFLSEGILRLNDYSLLGKDIKVFLRNDVYGNPKNEPKLKGNSVYYDGKKTLIKKGIFTSCGENNNCPPWSITSNEIVHDKEKREIHYKNAWLRLYNTPVIYFPKFFHPDPTVDRKSGFLQPTFSDSNNLGASIIAPYFHVISDSEDLTFKPRFFSTTEYLLQSEYRKVTKNSSHIFDISLNEDNDNNGRKNHFFSKSIFNLKSKFFDESNINLELQRVSNDNYTKLYDLESTSPIINDTSVLENLIEYSGSKDDLNFEMSFESYETMNRLNSDRYEFVYPNYNLQKTIYLEEDNFFDNFDFTSSGNQKKFTTNIYEAVQINDLLLTSNSFKSEHGLNSDLKTVIKNVNSNGKNSSKFKDKTQSEFLSMLSYDLNIPLIKEDNEYRNLLTPKLSLRHSPNDSKNLKDESRITTVENIFSLNRIGFNQTIEGGSSLTLGLDFEKKDREKNDTVLSSKIATVFRDEVNENLPISSTLGEKHSDFIGQINYMPNSKFKVNYNYSLNNNLDKVNLHQIENVIEVNNFVNTFTFYEENNLIGKKSYFENDISYIIDENNSLSFKTRENKTDNLTEYYKLVYEYKNDCLTASIRYNKEYYSNSSIKPNEELFFNITLIPLGSTKTDSVLK